MKSFKGILYALCLTCIVASTAIAAEMTGNAPAGASLYESCVPCHGLNGKDIAGMKVDNIMAAFTKMKNGTFTEPLKIGMQKTVEKLSPQQQLDVATYVSQM